MRLEVGPFPSAGGQEWVTQARGLVRGLRGNPGLPFVVPHEVLDEFESYLEEWARAASSEPFLWSRDIDLTALRTLMTYWVNLALYLADHPENLPSGSPEARAFYRNLSAGILAALAAEDPAARVLQERWPEI